MGSTRRFRWILPAWQVPAAALFGGWGLWQRNKILSHDYLFGIGWNTTARFHVWPWPFKFAVVTNLPAVLLWAVLGWPIGERWPDTPEGIMAAPALFFAALLWYAIGVWMDRRWGGASQSPSEVKTPWVLLGLFTALSVIASCVYVQFPTSAYLLLGAVLWLAIGLGVGTLTIFRQVRAGPAKG
jgi:hypothetical protein